jgi:Big-like domain-containing protein
VRNSKNPFIMMLVVSCALLWRCGSPGAPEDAERTTDDALRRRAVGGACHRDRDCAIGLSCNLGLPSGSNVPRNTCYDSTIPSLSLETPVEGDGVSGTITVAGTASDNVGVYELNIWIDNELLAPLQQHYVPQLSSQPFSIPLDTTQLTSGPHILTVGAGDLRGNGFTVSLHFDVENATARGGVGAGCQANADCEDGLSCNLSLPAGSDVPRNTCYDSTIPSLVLTSPMEGDGLSGVVSVSGTASDNIGIYELNLWVDNQLLAPLQQHYVPQLPSQPFSIMLDTTALANGAHVLTVGTADLRGNGFTYSFHVYVQNAASAGGGVGAPCQTGADCSPALVCNDSQTPAAYAPPNTCYDEALPSVTIDAPAVQGGLSGVATVSGTATDNVGIYQLRVEIDFMDVVPMFVFDPQLPRQPYSVQFDTMQFPNGDHILTVAAYDHQGHGNSYSFHVYVVNP